MRVPTVRANDIVVVGAGPVGLWTAIQLKKRYAGANIVIYERHEVYQRFHVLRLDHWSLLLYGAFNRQPWEQAFYQDVTGKSVGRVRLAFSRSLYIRTNDLETALRAYASHEGLTLVNRKISSAAEVQALHPGCTMFVAADGAHSVLRQELLGSDAVTRHDLQRVVELKFETVGEPRRLSLRQLWQLNRRLPFTVTEHVGRKKGEATPVTLRLLVDRATYDALPEMSFKSPLSLGHTGLPASIRDSVTAYLEFREAELRTAAIPNSSRLSKLPLHLYAAKNFAVLHGSRAWFLVGDAAMGVPYFRSLNCGMLLGSRLAMLVGRNGGLEPKKLPKLVARFERRRAVHVAVEFNIARAKDGVLNLFKSVRAAVASAHP